MATNSSLENEKLVRELMPPLLPTANDERLNLLLIGKIGSKQNLLDLQKGQIRFKRLKYYKSQENIAQPWADRNEGLSAIYPPNNIKVEIHLDGGRRLILDKSNGLNSVIGHSEYNPFISCFYSIYYNQYELNEHVKGNLDLTKMLKPDHSLSKFGDHVLLVHDYPQFIKYLHLGAQAANLVIKSGFVNYVDPQNAFGFLDKKSICLTKTVDFKSEREYRLLIEDSTQGDTFYLQIPNIEQITSIVSIEKFLNASLSMKNDKNQSV